MDMKTTIKIFITFCLATITCCSYANTLCVSNLSDSNNGSLSQVITNANNGDTIIFKISNAQTKIINLSQPITIDKNLTINGINQANGDTIILNQNLSDACILTISGKNLHVTLENLKITNGTKGAIFLNANNTLILNGCKVYSNKYNYSYSTEFGAIYADKQSSLYLNRCEISGNTGSDAAGIYGNYAYVEMNQTLLSNNHTSSDGRAIKIYGGTLLLKDCTIKNNTVGVSGIYAKMNLYRCTISGGYHTGNANGGGLSTYEGCDVYIEDSNIINNLAGEGAGICSWGGNIVIKRSNISDNYSTTDAGGIQFSGNKLLIDSCTIRNNTAFNRAGGVNLWCGKAATIQNSIIDNNKATNGWSENYGGGICSVFTPFTLINSTISNNKAYNGAGLSATCQTDSILLINNTFYNNIASNTGGAIYLVHFYGNMKDAMYYLPTYPKSIFINNTITNNSALDGGGIYFNPTLFCSGDGIIHLYNNIIALNSNYDFKQAYNTNTTTYIKGKNNIGIFTGLSTNVDAQFINYNSTSNIFKSSPPILSNNGGYTPTVELSNNSMAIGKGIAMVTGFSIPSTDQRGYKRYYRPTIGSFEIPVYPSTPFGALPATNVTENSFVANWLLNKEATNYYLDVSMDNFKTFVPGYQNKSIGNVSSYLLQGISSNANYQYRVRIANDIDVSDNSDTILVSTLANPNFKISSISPVVGTVGTKITLTGIGFNKIATNDTIYFSGNVKAVVLSATETSIIAIVPYCTESGPITIKKSDGLSTTSNEIFTPTSLPVTNYKVQTTNCTCRGSNDGMIMVTFATNLDYKVTITGTSYSKTEHANSSIYKLNNLPADTYQINFSIDSVNNYCQSFSFTITQPQDMSVMKVKSAENIVQYSMTGGKQYYVSVNDITQIASDSTLTIPLQNGKNRISIWTDKLCQGKYEETIYFNDSGKISIFPNPTDGLINIEIPNNEEKVMVEVSTLNGAIVLQQIIAVPANKLVTINATSLATGLYTVRISGSTLHSTIKMVKK